MYICWKIETNNNSGSDHIPEFHFDGSYSMPKCMHMVRVVHRSWLALLPNPFSLFGSFYLIYLYPKTMWCEWGLCPQLMMLLASFFRAWLPLVWLVSWDGHYIGGSGPGPIKTWPSQSPVAGRQEQYCESVVVVWSRDAGPPLWWLSLRVSVNSSLAFVQAIALPFSLVGLLKDFICFLKEQFSQKSCTFPNFFFFFSFY